MERPEPQLIDFYKRINQPKKCNRLNTWRSQGIVSDNWDKTYMEFMNKSNCEINFSTFMGIDCYLQLD